MHGLCFSISSVSFKRETALENIYKSPSLELLLTEAETGLSRVRSIPFHGTIALVQPGSVLLQRFRRRGILIISRASGYGAEPREECLKVFDVFRCIGV